MKKHKNTFTVDDIDIFILTHNRADYLAESISCMLNQTAGVKHITVLDNESTDNTKETVARFKDRGVNYVYTTGHLGNFNKAREIVSKPFCMLFHDDDILHPKYLEIVLDILNNESDISLITTRYREFFNNHLPELPLNIDKSYMLFSEKHQWASFMYFHEIVAYATAVYRTKDFLANDLEYDRFNKFNDWPFMAKMARTGNVALLTDPNVFFVRRHSGQNTWTSTNTPSIDQIINWSLFYYQETGACTSDSEFNTVFIKYISHFLNGHYNSFISDQDKQKYSYKDVFKRLIDLAHQNGLPFNLSVKESLTTTHKTGIDLYKYMSKFNASIVTKCNYNLQLCLITYNRAYWLERTLKQLYAQNSPVKNMDMIILDNASSDDTPNIIKKYQKKFPNIKYQRHNLNIGGNANICRAFEVAANSGKDYLWVLCDDDYYDWSNWAAVENEMARGTDCIGVARYVMENDGQLNNPAYQFLQLTFVPAGIYKTSIINNTVLTNMYDTIYTMFQQSCIAAHAMNNYKKIVFLAKPIVENGLHIKDENEPIVDNNYFRGSDPTEASYRRKEARWIFGYSNIVRMLNDENLSKQCMATAIPYKDMYGSWENFYNSMNEFTSADKIHYLYELNTVLPDDKKIKMLLSRSRHHKRFRTRIGINCNIWDYIQCLGYKLSRPVYHLLHPRKKHVHLYPIKKYISFSEKMENKKLVDMSLLQILILPFYLMYKRCRNLFKSK